jgi:hypothetical protein
MLLNTIVRETTTNVIPGTAVGVLLGQEPIKTALVNLAVAAIVRLTSHLVAKRRARRAARKASSSND